MQYEKVGLKYVRGFKFRSGNEESNCVMARMKWNKTSAQRKTSWDLKLINTKKGCSLTNRSRNESKEQAFSGFEYYKWTCYIQNNVFLSGANVIMAKLLTLKCKHLKEELVEH